MYEPGAPCCPGISEFSFHLCSSTGAPGLQEERGETTCAELAGGKLIIVKHFHLWPFESVSNLTAFLLWAETPATLQGQTRRRPHWSSPSDGRGRLDSNSVGLLIWRRKKKKNTTPSSSRRDWWQLAALRKRWDAARAAPSCVNHTRARQRGVFTHPSLAKLLDDAARAKKNPKKQWEAVTALAILSLVHFFLQLTNQVK